MIKTGRYAHAKNNAVIYFGCENLGYCVPVKHVLEAFVRSDMLSVLAAPQVKPVMWSHIVYLDNRCLSAVLQRAPLVYAQVYNTR